MIRDWVRKRYWILVVTPFVVMDEWKSVTRKFLMCQRWVTKRKALFNHLLPRGRYSRVIRTGCTVLYCTRMYGVIPTVLGGWFGSAVCTRSQRLKTSRNRKRNTVAKAIRSDLFCTSFLFRFQRPRVGLRLSLYCTPLLLWVATKT